MIFFSILLACEDKTPIDAEAYADQDADGYLEDDCNDDDPTIHPDAEDLVGDEIDQNLLNEVTYLVESPSVIPIEFPKRFLSLPKEALTECLKKH